MALRPYEKKTTIYFVFWIFLAVTVDSVALLTIYHSDQTFEKFLILTNVLQVSMSILSFMGGVIYARDSIQEIVEKGEVWIREPNSKCSGACPAVLPSDTGSPWCRLA